MKNDILDLGLGKKIQTYRLNKKLTIKELSEKIRMTYAKSDRKKFS